MAVAADVVEFVLAYLAAQRIAMDSEGDRGT
jgi:hypothetical protein